MLFILKILKNIGNDDYGNTVLEWSNIGIFTTEEEAKFTLYDIRKKFDNDLDEGEYQIDAYEVNEPNLSDFDFQIDAY
jgi:hypothetical protein